MLFLADNISSEVEKFLFDEPDVIQIVTTCKPEVRIVANFYSGVS